MQNAPGCGRTGAAPLWPAFVVPSLGLALAGCGAALVARGVTHPAGHSDVGAAVGLAAAVLGCSVVLAWTIAAALAVLAVLAGRHRWPRVGRFCRRCSPALLRRTAAAVLGLQLIAAPGAVAHEAPSPFWAGDAAVHGTATPSADGPDGPAGPATPHAPDVPGTPPGVPPTTEPPPVPPAPSPAARTVDGAVTVVRGDTLWSLAAAHLGPGATDEQIARAWPVWYELNRDVLVDGPHLILPGQRLLVPGTAHP